MRAFNHGGRIFRLLLAGLLCASSVPNRLLADDKDSSNPPSKSAPAKSDASKMEAPAPLTERERWLLDRVEQLEKNQEQFARACDRGTVFTARFVEPNCIQCRGERRGRPTGADDDRSHCECHSCGKGSRFRQPASP